MLGGARGQEMSFASELETRVAQFTSEKEDIGARLKVLDGLIVHAKALLEEENNPSSLPAGKTEQAGFQLFKDLRK